MLVPGTSLSGTVAPYVAVEAAGDGELTLASGDVTLTATYDRTVTLHVTTGGRTTSHRSRRSGRPEGPVEGVALALTGPQVTAFTREAGAWVARSRHDLTDRHDVHDESGWPGSRAPGPEAGSASSGSATSGWSATPTAPRCGTASSCCSPRSSAGPGAFATGHASVWGLDPVTYELEHRADLFLRRGGVYGDHAVHLVRDGDRWLLAASTWGDFDRKTRPVRITLSESTADLTTGVHVLDSRPLAFPSDGLRSVGLWDPHLVRTDDGWLVGAVSATRYFRFHPVLAQGPDLDRLTLRASAEGHRETEGTTLVRLDEGWRVLASDRHRRVYPLLDLELREIGTLEAAYPTNIPWPTIVASEGQNLLVGFNGSRYGGRLVGYGSHGDVVIQRAVSR